MYHVGQKYHCTCIIFWRDRGNFQSRTLFHAAVPVVNLAPHLCQTWSYSGPWLRSIEISLWSENERKMCTFNPNLFKTWFYTVKTFHCNGCDGHYYFHLAISLTPRFVWPQCKKKAKTIVSELPYWSFIVQNNILFTKITPSKCIQDILQKIYTSSYSTKGLFEFPNTMEPMFYDHWLQWFWSQMTTCQCQD